MGPKKINYDKDIRKLLEELQFNTKKGYERLFDKNCGNVILQEEYSSSNFERRFNQLSNVGTLEEFQKKYQIICDNAIMHLMHREIKMAKMFK